jgi:hypothetical protein
MTRRFFTQANATGSEMLTAAAAILLALLILAGSSTTAPAQNFWKGSENCVVGAVCCYGFSYPGHPKICGTLEQLQTEAVRCKLIEKTYLPNYAPPQFIQRCGEIGNAALAIASQQRVNAQMRAEREQAQRLLNELNRR